MRYIRQTLILLIFLILLTTTGFTQSRVPVYVVVEPAPQDKVHIVIYRSDGRPLDVRTENLGNGVWRVYLRPGAYRIELQMHAAIVTSRDITVGMHPSQVVRLTIEPLLKGHAEIEVRGTAPTVELQRPIVTHTVSETRVEVLPVTRTLQLQDLLAETVPGVVRSHDDIAHVRGAEISIGYNLNGSSLLGSLNPILGLGPDPDVFEWLQLRTGAYPARYGWRFMGQMEVLPRSGVRQARPRGRLELAGGTQTTYQGRFALATGRDRWGLFLHGSALRTDQYFQPRGYDIVHDTGKTGRLFLRGDLQWSDRLWTAVTGFWNFGNMDVPIDPAIDVWSQAMTIQESGGLIETTYTGAALQIQLNLIAFRQIQRLDVAALRDGTPMEHARRDDRTFGMDFMVTHTVSPDLDIEWGIQTRRLIWNERLVPLPMDAMDMHMNTHATVHAHTETEPVDTHPVHLQDSGWITGVYTDLHFRWTEWLRLNLGIRLDRFDLLERATYLSPRINVLIRPRHATIGLLVSYNRLVWVPPLENYLISSRSPDSRPLRPSVSDVVEVGIRGQYRTWRMQVNAFVRYTRDLFHTVQATPLYWFPFANFRAERIYGLETSVRGRIGQGLSLGVNYILSWHYMYNPLTGGYGAAAADPHDRSRFFAPMDQRHTVNGWITWQWHQNGYLTLSGTWASGLPAMHPHHGQGGMTGHTMSMPTSMEESMHTADAPERMPAYLYLNGSVGYRIARQPNVWIRVDAENLLNRRVPITVASMFTPAQYLPARKVLAALQVVW